MYRGIGGERSPFISFVGLSSDGSGSISNFSIRSNIEAKVNGSGQHVDIVDRISSEARGIDILELGGVHYTDWRDFDNNTFSSAVGVASFINDYQYNINDGKNVLEPLRKNGHPTAYSLTSGSQYSLKIEYDGVGRYYWDESSIPPGMDISRYDNRIIEGTPTTPGTYTVYFELGNAFGLFPQSLDITVS